MAKRTTVHKNKSNQMTKVNEIKKFIDKK